MHANCGAMIEAIGAAPTVQDRWASVSRLLGEMGIDQVNYGIIDTNAAARVDAPVRFLSTMDATWIDYYGDKRFDLDDPHVTFVRQNNLVPYRWGENVLPRLEGRARAVVAQTCEAGLRAQWQVTLPDSDGSIVPIGGMAIGSSLSPREFAALLRGNEAALVTIAHLFHFASIGEIRRRHAGVPALSGRERDALAFAADGHRADRIADRMGITRVTVELHLRNARRKLKAPTLPAAIAKAFLYGELKHG